VADPVVDDVGRDAEAGGDLGDGEIAIAARSRGGADVVGAADVTDRVRGDSTPLPLRIPAACSSAAISVLV
jgi:hypothetical protein